MEKSTISQAMKGGEFLLKTPSKVFAPEEYTEEQHVLRKSIRDFLDKEIEPNKALFDCVEGTMLAPKKLEILGGLGYLGLSVPEEFGGFGCNIKTDLAASEIMSDSFAFSQTLGIQRGLGINTILFYGNKKHKDKYLDGIISGQIKCSYCLTEPGAGSDAASGKSKAVLSEDGKHYILSGQKMWITNSGFADVFSVFCKIEDDPHLSCLLVEKEWGVQVGEEERKLGIHGSSTCQVFFENVKVPIENLIGERNKGFKIAMNALNMGRLMIGVAGTAIAKRGFNLGVDYANQRIQFNKPISSFGAIQEKIAKMACRIFALESSWNRLGGEMDDFMNELLEQDVSVLQAKQKVAAEFATECAIIKVYGSETEQFVIDEALQMHGGMGYSAESDISVLYRNIRGNRIYEGTNEINRQVIPGTILKYALKGKLPLMEALIPFMAELQSGQLNSIESNDSPTVLAFDFLASAKKGILLLAGIAMQKFQSQIKDQQEVLARLSDLLGHLYLLESTILRVNGRGGISEKATYVDIMLLQMQNSSELFHQSAKEIIFAAMESDQASSTLESIQQLFKLPVLNIIETRRKVAQHFIKQNRYKL